MPRFWWEDYCRMTNGNFGFDDLTDEDGSTLSHSKWTTEAAVTSHAFHLSHRSLQSRG